MRKKTDRKKASIKKKKLDSKIITDSEEEEKPKKQEIKYPKNWRSDDYSINSDITEDTYKKKKTPNKTQKNNKIKENNQNVGKKKTIKKYKKDSDKENKRDEKIDIEMKDETKENNNEDNPCLNNNYLPCREKEQKKIYDYIKKGLETNGNYNSLYIAGMPGTGKTACVKAVIDIIETEIKKKKKENLNFTKLFICGTEYPNISNIYKAIYNFIFSSNRNIKTKRYSQYLNKFFENRDKIKKINLNDPSNSHIILIIDEIDFLINKNQNALYNIFNWSIYENSRLIIISISNTLDLPNRLLPKIKSRMGNNKIMFKPYTKDELINIIKSKGIEYDKFNDDAKKLCCVKVSAINGDLRRVIQILLRAKELYNSENKRKSKYKKIEKEYILKACDDLFNSKLKNVINSLQICEKIIICAILSSIKDNNDNRVKLGDLYNKLDIFFDKYNEAKKKDKIEDLELYWEEYKKIIYNLLRIQLISFSEIPKNNFLENSITIKFYVDEFINSCADDKELKPVIDYLTNIISA